MNKTIAFIDELSARYDVLHNARQEMTVAEEMILRTKHRLAEAERELDELRTRLHADAPRETCTNETQRRAYALEMSGDAAALVRELRETLVDDEIRVIRAKSYLRGAEDLRRFLETIAHVAALPEAPVIG